jgi:hypothetical protein
MDYRFPSPTLSITKQLSLRLCHKQLHVSLPLCHKQLHVSLPLCHKTTCISSPLPQNYMYLFPFATNSYMYLFPSATNYMYLFPSATNYMYLFPSATNSYMYLFPSATNSYVYLFPSATNSYMYLFPSATNSYMYLFPSITLLLYYLSIPIRTLSVTNLCILYLYSIFLPVNLCLIPSSLSLSQTAISPLCLPLLLISISCQHLSPYPKTPISSSLSSLPVTLSLYSLSKKAIYLISSFSPSCQSLSLPSFILHQKQIPYLFSFVSPFYLILCIPNSFLFSSHPFYHFLSLPSFILINNYCTSKRAICSPTSPPHITQYCRSRQPPSLSQNPFFSPLSSPPKYITLSLTSASLFHNYLFLRLLFFVLVYLCH